MELIRNDESLAVSKHMHHHPFPRFLGSQLPPTLPGLLPTNPPLRESRPLVVVYFISLIHALRDFLVREHCSILVNIPSIIINHPSP